MKTVKLVGPKDVELTFVQDGVPYRVANGEVKPELPEGKVPDNLFGLGFTVVEDAPVKLKPAIKE